MRGRARQRAPRAEWGGAASAAQRSSCSAGPTGQLGGGWAVSPARPRGPYWPPVGRPPPGRRRGAAGLLRSRGGRARPSRRRRTRGIRAPTLSLLALPPPPSSSRALAPTVGLRQRPGRTRAAPGRPGEWPRATLCSSRTPLPALAFAAAARRGLPRQRPRQQGRPRQGKLD